MTIPVWAKMLFKFRQHGPLVFLLETYKFFSATSIPTKQAEFLERLT